MKVLIFYVVIFILSPKVCFGKSTEKKNIVDFWCVDAVDSLTVYAGGGDGVIMKTSDGEQWYQLPTGVSTEFQTIFFLNPDTGWAGGELGTLIKTTDGGQNWQTLLSTTSNLILSVYFSDPNTGWFCTNHGNIFKSTNGGMNWQLKNSGTSDPLSKIYFCDADTGWVCGNYETVLKTTNGGDNWVYTNYQQYSISLYDLCFISNRIGWASGGWGYVLNSDNGGVTWQWQQSNTADLLVGICFVNATTGWAVGYGGSGSTGITIKSTTGGTSWQELTTGTTVRLFGLDFINETTGWIVGENGTIRKTTDGGISWYPHTLLDINQSTQNIAVSAELYPNYPNPFNPVTTIQYDIPHTARVVLKIYDMLGQQVKTLVDEVQSPGPKSVIWDGKDQQENLVSSGIYFYQLQSENSIITKKMMFLK